MRLISLGSIRSLILGFYGFRGFRLFRSLLFSFISFLFFIPQMAFAQLSESEDIVFSPLEGEGYLQAYNINFQGNGVYIYATFVVSNMGPGDRNNGVSTVVYRQGKSSIFIDESTDSSLTATPGKFGMKTAQSYLKLENGNYVAYVKVKDLELNLTLKAPQRGVRISNGFIQTPNGGKLRADIPIAYASATGTMKIGDTVTPLSGVGAMEYIMTDKSPHTYAKRFVLYRTYTADRGFFLGGYEGIKDEDFLIRTVATNPKSGVTMNGTIKTKTILSKDVDAFSGYEIAKKVVYTLKESECTITATRANPRGSIYILANVSALLRWVMRVFFAKPYILHYGTLMEYSCPGQPVVTYPGHVTYYIIN